MLSKFEFLVHIPCIIRSNGRAVHLVQSGGKGQILMMRKVGIVRGGGEKVERGERRTRAQSRDMRQRKQKLT